MITRNSLFVIAAVLLSVVGLSACTPGTPSAAPDVEISMDEAITGQNALMAGTATGSVSLSDSEVSSLITEFSKANSLTKLEISGATADGNGLHVLLGSPLAGVDRISIDTSLNIEDGVATVDLASAKAGVMAVDPETLALIASQLNAHLAGLSLGLPDGTYKVTPEMASWLNALMIQSGLNSVEIAAVKTAFDSGKIHIVVELAQPIIGIDSIGLSGALSTKGGALSLNLEEVSVGNLVADPTLVDQINAQIDSALGGVRLPVSIESEDGTLTVAVPGIHYPPSPNRDDRIVGGVEAKPGAWPWQARLTISKSTGNYLCGGSLVDAEWVITAAHCIYDEAEKIVVAPTDVKVNLGDYDIEKDEDSEQVFAVIDILTHPAYDPNTYLNDIALIKLENDVQMNEKVQPIALVESPFHDELVAPGIVAMITGWGGTQVNQLSLATKLRQGKVPIISNNECNAHESYNENITDNMLCAGLKSGGIDACQGDSGGPLIVPDGSGWRLAGITSWGKGCGLPNFYGVYTRISSYIDWIAARKQVTSPLVVANAAEPGAWPWQARLIISTTVGTKLCGGSLIKPEWVATAAHCVSNRETGEVYLKENVWVTLGDYNRTTPEDSEQTFAVTAIIVHPEYDRYTLEDDIALIRLKVAARLTDRVQPIALVGSSSDDELVAPNVMATFTGWGAMYEGDQLSEVMRQGAVPIVSNDTCNGPQSYKGRISDNMLCAGLTSGGIDACAGFGGGPLVVGDEQKWRLAGITSWGQDCGRPNFYGVYTRVSSYVSWIEEETSPDSQIATERVLDTGRLINGHPAELEHSRWQARVTASGRGICGGSLIDANWVVTAAHCLYDWETKTEMRPTDVWVTLGDHYRLRNNPTEQIIFAQEIIIHPEYKEEHFTLQRVPSGFPSGYAPTAPYDDIALIKLREPAQLNNNVQPISLTVSPNHDKLAAPTVVATITGWGATHEGGQAIDELMEVDIPIVDLDDCNSPDSYNGAISVNMLCAGIASGGVDACQGDSGGPLIIRDGEDWRLAGITSWGIGCGQPKFYGVYTRVSSYVDWISQNSAIKSTLPRVVAPTSGPTPIPEDVDIFLSEPGDLPWQARIGTKEGFCNGSLIDAKWVITTAYCVSEWLAETNSSLELENSSNLLEEVWVTLGDYDYSINEDSEQTIAVTNIFIHPEYDRETFENNIALIRLETAALLNDRVQPISLVQSPTHDALVASNSVASFTGWGAVRRGDQPSRILRKGTVSIVSNDTCNGSEYYNGQITDGMLCAEVETRGFGACNGFGGGSLVVSDEPSWRLAGIVSHVEDCGRPNHLGVYTRVSTYIPWITEQLAIQLLKNDSFEQNPQIAETIWRPDARGTDLSTSWATEQARSGTRALSLSTSRSGNGGWPGWFIRDFISLEPAQEYQFNAWAYSLDNAQARISAELLDEFENTLRVYTTDCLPVDQWYELELTFSTGDVPNATQVRLGLQQCIRFTEERARTLYYDDVWFGSLSR